PRQELRREVAEGRHDLRLDQLDLAEEVAFAGLDLLGLWVAVPWRAAFQRIADIDVLTGEPDPPEQLAEQLARRADERDALLVLVEARRLADEHQVCGRRARSEHDLRASSRQRATRAAGDGVAECDERELAFSRSHSFRHNN